ncbi:1-pyrroline-5-carboxylate reductase [Thermoplasma volcanium GSS1]|uniref:Pyrroline-5-carboxylate reductase n=1 Tax=Thermoplasma volcanium (strain ATCC 51530 / DSM 4299 / JCM 9571 / NBRC 15438 / GSS1) TaxID=273116 RepID=Q979J7_THEVO|nr:pyrroline-5-carboxylate reductase [Thermoplasma volcanium]BAB60306.1 1-pyrroline-5-carboxylate reductase [Thermoplasma volcanium GSS1]
MFIKIFLITYRYKLTVISIIGGGTIGSSIAIPLKRSGFEVIVTRRNTAVLKHLESYGISVMSDNKTASKEADVVFLTLKPVDIIPEVRKIEENIRGKLLISMAAAIPLKLIKDAAPHSIVVRAMTNIAAKVGAGFTPFCVDDGDQEVAKRASSILSALGEVYLVEEKYMDALTALSGSGPAYILTIIEAMMYGGLKLGLPRDLALKASYQTVMGSAKLLAESGEHPSELKEKVITPGGTTIDGIYELEDARVRTAIMKAIEVSTMKANKISESIKKLEQ